MIFGGKSIILERQSEGSFKNHETFKSGQSLNLSEKGRVLEK